MIICLCVIRHPEDSVSYKYSCFALFFISPTCDTCEQTWNYSLWLRSQLIPYGHAFIPHTNYSCCFEIVAEVMRYLSSNSHSNKLQN
ncbi:hypothetical protein GDO81_011012 [Engystomops pustulosus]|uniref:Uncharacterized protein n=1 Tax=Engystomops pustulosus TaxID=76066 RepID=A0AAV7C406_ENGPU|nr:hypothetical protein GDO81_011012 [Engystomops pustulosus]